MDVNILDVSSNSLISATIRSANANEMPTIQEGWVFNFDKHANLPNSKAFILITKGTPQEIEGALIFQLLSGYEPYMSFVEVAPLNKTKPKKYDYVAGCLIAYACKLSFEYGKGDYEGWLRFNVTEEPESERESLVRLYHNKYGALRLDQTGLLISPKQGKMLIETFLK